MTNYKDKYNFIKKPSDLVFEEELTERINDFECLEKLLLYENIDYTRIPPKEPTFTGRGEFEEYFDGDEGKKYGKDVSKNILVCKIKFLGNINMYIIYNTKDEFVLCHHVLILQYLILMKKIVQIFPSHLEMGVNIYQYI